MNNHSIKFTRWLVMARGTKLKKNNWYSLSKTTNRFGKREQYPIKYTNNYTNNFGDFLHSHYPLPCSIYVKHAVMNKVHYKIENPKNPYLKLFAPSLLLHFSGGDPISFR
jgi:hypothetical protein